MTLKEIEEMEADILNREQVADVLRTTAQTIRRQARENPQLLNFPVTVLGSRVVIPRQGFIYFMKYGHPKR